VTWFGGVPFLFLRDSLDRSPRSIRCDRSFTRNIQVRWGLRVEAESARPNDEQRAEDDGGVGLTIARRRAPAAGRVSAAAMAFSFSAVGLVCAGLIAAITTTAAAIY
jgi:hypothetical protein